MSYVRVPQGLTRSRIGNRIVYESNSPGLRVRIWKHSDFDNYKEKGRFSNIDRGELDFSSKKANLPDDMEVDKSVEDMDIDGATELDHPAITLALGASTTSTSVEWRLQGSLDHLNNPKQTPENKIRSQVKI